MAVQWKAPNRLTNEITQDFNDGVLTVYSVENTAQPGYRPVEGLVKKATLRYNEER